MLSRARVALLALLLVLVTAGPAAGHVVAPAAETSVSTRTTDAAASQPDQETLRIQIRSNGDARWRVTMNFSLESPAQRDAFQTLAADFEDREDSRTLTAVRAASRQASATTGRQMSITNVERATRTANGTGTLILRFTWTNFGRQTSSALHVDDVLNTTSGTWLGRLDADQSLVIAPPNGYSLDDADPPGYGVSNGELRWDGERTFEPGDISVSYERVTNKTSPSTPSTPATPGQGSSSILVVFAVVGGLGVVAALAYLFSNGEAGIPAVLSTRTDDSSDEAVDTATTTGAATTAAAGTDDGGAADDEIDEELLSDEERIERLLDQNGGRMKQANIVTETGWSNAKVSQLLSAMDEDDRIDKLRIGRENLISFPDEDITDNGEES